MTDRNSAGTGRAVEPEPPRLDDRLPVIPVGGTVIFPGVVVPLALTDPALVRAVQAAMRGERLLVLLSLRPGRLPKDDDGGAGSPFYDVGTLGGVVRVLELPDGSIRALVQGLSRVDVAEKRRDGGLWSVAARPRPDLSADRARAEALRGAVTAALSELLDQSTDLPGGARETMLRVTDLSELTDLAAANLSIPAEAKQGLLEERDLGERTQRVLDGLRRENREQRSGDEAEGVPAPAAPASAPGPRPAIDDARARALLERNEHEDGVGAASGLAYTPAGGQILFVEAVAMPGSGAIRLTGQVEPLLYDAAQVALSCLRSQAERLQIPPERFREQDVHIHVPAGATPGDGPSAGLALAVALASALTGRPVHPALALTGELTLRGRVLPVGGIGARLVAAANGGFRTVLLPRANAADLLELPDEGRATLVLELVDDVGDALEHALVERRGIRRGGDARPAGSGDTGRGHGHWYDPG